MCSLERGFDISRHGGIAYTFHYILLGCRILFIIPGLRYLRVVISGSFSLF